MVVDPIASQVLEHDVGGFVVWFITQEVHGTLVLKVLEEWYVRLYGCELFTTGIRMANLEYLCHLVAIVFKVMKERCPARQDVVDKFLERILVDL